MDSRAILVLSLLLLGASALRPADFFDYVAEAEFLSVDLAKLKEYNQTQFWFEKQLIDHFNPEDNRTFRQRYWTVDQYWDVKSGPIILYICGEYECPGLPKARLYPLALAKKYQALIVVLEHRFYGASQPFTDLSTEHLRYLTTDQALDDLAYFIHWANNEPSLKIGNDRHWVTYGGSYPGALSAWFRYKFPHLTAGAVASSAVINSIIDYTDYDHQLYLAALKSGPACPQRLQELNRYVEEQLNSSNATSLKKSYGAENLTDIEFLGYYADSIAGAVQHGNRTGLCKLVSNDTFEVRYEAMRQFVVGSNKPNTYKADYFKNDSYYAGRDASRQWTWQVCSELGWFQSAHKDAAEAMRSQRLDISVSLDQCKEIFGETVQPDAELANSKRGGLELDVSNLIIVNGGEDPWQWASRTKNYGQTLSYLIDCDDCSHCVEMSTPTEHDSWNLWWARVKITYHFGRWVKRGSIIGDIETVLSQ